MAKVSPELHRVQQLLTEYRTLNQRVLKRMNSDNIDQIIIGAALGCALDEEFADKIQEVFKQLPLQEWKEIINQLEEELYQSLHFLGYSILALKDADGKYKKVPTTTFSNAHIKTNNLGDERNISVI